MNRSKLSIKAILLMSGIGLAGAVFAGSQPAAAQSYSGEYGCSAGYVYDPSYGCVLPDYAYEPSDYGYPYDYGYYGYSPYYGGYGSRYNGGYHEFGHGFAHGMGGGFAHGDFTHGVSGGFAHGGGGGYG